MPIYITSVRMAAEQLAAAKKSAVDLARGLVNALSQAAMHQDPNLSDQGVVTKRAELAREFREAASVDLQNLTDGIEGAHRKLGEYARENTALPADADAAALIRAEQKWRQVERQLDAGIDLRTVLATADVDTAVAVLEFGPAWAAATGYRRPTLQEAVASAMSGEQLTTDTTQWLQRLAYERIAEVTTDPELAELLRAATAADSERATAMPYLEAAQSLVDHGTADMLAAGIASRLAEASASVAAQSERGDGHPRGI